MENPGAVSLWFGNCRSEDLLRQYVDIKYDDNGDRISSKFMTDFKIEFSEYNQDLLECTYSEYPTSLLSELLKNASYSDPIIPELEEFYGQTLTEQYNVVIRLYDFEYEEVVEEAKLDGKELTFIGSVIYEE